MRRAYFSSFEPIDGTPLGDQGPGSLAREHRLYQSDWLLRIYHYNLRDIKGIITEEGNLPKGDPKVHFARQYFEEHNLLDPNKASYQELLKTVDFLNNDPEVDGFIVQLPLPDHIDADKVTQAIDPKKDVDGFHPVNLGRMMIGLPAYLPATPNGIMEMLKRYKIETEGKHCVVLGRSNIVGTPMSILMSRKSKPGNATVTLCHSRTQNLKEIVQSADILIAAIGKKEFVTADMVKDGAVVIDVGIHREKSDKTKSGFKLKGDVAFDEVSKKASFITPVPGGVGPMTIVSLLMNTLKAYKKEVYTD
ncbi:MAG: tetrahydrofolate dehydrogenase/cyclohydrolase catalytic domain-containing protein [Bacteroidales bacterium]